MKKIILTYLTFFLMLNVHAQNALSFDGVNDHVNGGNSATVQITGTLITLEAWIYPTAWTTNFWQGNIINKEDDSNNSGYMLRCGNNGMLNFNIGNGSWNELTTDAATLTLNTWQHVAGTYDGNKMRLYVDGVPVDSSSTSISILNTGNSQNLTIGNWSFGTFERGFIGAIDDARVWDVYRSKNDIESNMGHEICSAIPGLVAYYKFNEGVASGVNTGVTAAPDFTANANDGTLTNFALSGSISNWTAGIVSGVDSNIEVVSICDVNTYTWSDGITYTSNNSIATQTFQNAYGCDSIITLNLTFNTSSVATDVQTACSGSTFTWIDGVDYLTDNSTATYTISNSGGCDSTVTLNLTFSNASNTGVDVQSACANTTFNWIDGVDYFSDNSTATYTLTNAAGCDSVVTLNLTFLASVTGVDVQAACDVYTWIDGLSYTANNTTATHTLTSVNGCDSIVTLNLVINTVDSTVTTTDPIITANQIGGSYVWLDCENSYAEVAGQLGQVLTAPMNGEYAVEITNNGCVDTSACITIATVGLEESGIDLNTVLYPNPTNGMVTLSLGTIMGSVAVVIEDITGKQVMSIQMFNSDAMTLDLSELTNGIYMVKLESKEYNEVIKLIKE